MSTISSVFALFSVFAFFLARDFTLRGSARFGGGFYRLFLHGLGLRGNGGIERRRVDGEEQKSDKQCHFFHA